MQTLTIGQLGQGSRGGGSVLLYSTELQQQGLVAVNSRQARILESWGNGTNTEVQADSRLCMGHVGGLLWHHPCTVAVYPPNKYLACSAC